MKSSNNDFKGLATKAIRTGYEMSQEQEHSEAMFLTSSFRFNSAEQAAARFSHEEEGNIYSRFTNPTVKLFIDRLTAMEGGEAGVATGSGMSAILSTCLGIMQTGDHMVSSCSIFGTTSVLFNKYLKRLGIETSFVGLSNIEQWEQAIQANTKILFLETPSNPLTEIADLTALSKLAKKHHCLLVVDNCFCTPILQRPLEWGADIVIHSATKYLDGQGRCLGGAVIGSEKIVGEDVFGFLRSAGPSLSPFNAWVFAKALDTLKIRMHAHSQNARELATWLEQQPQIKRVYYPGLRSHPQYQLACQQHDDTGGILSFELDGGKPQAWKFINATQMLSITANLGDAKSTITHPMSTTHGRLSPEERERAGISDSLVRISVGLEDIADIQADVALGLQAL